MQFNENWDGIVRGNRKVVAEAKQPTVEFSIRSKDYDGMESAYQALPKRLANMMLGSGFDIRSRMRDHGFECKNESDMKAIVAIYKKTLGGSGVTVKKHTTESVHEAAATPTHGVKVGDIFYASWGYDQTNVSFHLVTKVTGASVFTIELEKSERLGTGAFDMQGTVTPSASKKPLQGAVPRRSVVKGGPYGSTIKVREVIGGGQVSHPLLGTLWDGRPKSVSHYG